MRNNYKIKPILLIFKFQLNIYSFIQYNSDLILKIIKEIY